MVSRLRLERAPTHQRDGEIGYLSNRALDPESELALTAELMCDRRLFGHLYSGLQPAYFNEMPRNSGVCIRPVVPTREIVARARHPGDIDLLVVPYEGQDLLLDRALAIEIKVVRASYAKQGKSPGGFGISQATGLLALGFPYAAVVHLIVSDSSPPNAWRETLVTEVLDREGRVSEPATVAADMMPLDLIRRTFGRLGAQHPPSQLGLAAVYLSGRRLQPIRRNLGSELWHPWCKPAELNPRFQTALLEDVARYFLLHQSEFLYTPRHDP